MSDDSSKTSPSDGQSPPDAESAGSPPTETRTSQDALPNAPIPRRIGPYSIKRAIATGGMGTVYEAVQEKPRRTVALKLMRAGIASRSALRRFEYESQLLARLRHPGVAQVFEAGTHRDGEVVIPYFAMEYIVGAKPITEYVRQKKFGTRERAALLAKVCDAVHHGHQKGIIHRDLKPSNILVDSSGQVKIIDFGVARCTDSDLAVTTLQTDVGQLIGTLQYMSPEQCAADPHDIDTRSDVYSLGVVFYEMLCERPPYDVRKAALHEATRVIREEDPTRLSTINRTLRGDVETIVLKALEKDRDRRYASVSALAADIDRYLNDQPISARPASAIYQFRKLVARHKAPFAFTALLFALVSGFAVWMSVLYGRAEQLRIEAVSARDEAEISRAAAQTSRDEAEQVVQFLSETLGAADPEKKGKEVTVREVMDQAAGQVAEKFSAYPLIEARLRYTIGWTYRSLGLLELAQAHLGEAAAIYTRALGPRDQRTLIAAQDHAVIIGDLGHFSKAEAAQRSTLEIQRRVLGVEHPTTVGSMNNLANSLSDQGRYAEAEELYRQTLEICSRVLGEEHPDTLKVMNNLANTFYHQGRYGQAEELYRQTVEIHRRVLGEEHPNTLTSRFNFAHSLRAQGRFADAEVLYSQTLDIQRRVLGEEHPATLRSMHHLAYSVSPQGRYAEAEALYRQTLEFYRRVLDAEHPDTFAPMNNLAGVLHSQGRYAEAEELYRQTLEIHRRVLGADHPQMAYPLVGLAEVMEKTERYAEAQLLCREAGSILAVRLPEKHRLRRNIGNLLGGTLAGLGLFAEAEPLLIESYEALESDAGIDPRDRDVMLDRFVRLYESWHAAEPEMGHDENAAHWRAQLDRSTPATP